PAGRGGRRRAAGGVTGAACRPARATGRRHDLGRGLRGARGRGRCGPARGPDSGVDTADGRAVMALVHSLGPMDERFAGLTPPVTGIRVARGEVEQPRAQLMKPRRDTAAVRCQLAPVLALCPPSVMVTGVRPRAASTFLIRLQTCRSLRPGSAAAYPI